MSEKRGIRPDPEIDIESNLGVIIGFDETVDPLVQHGTGSPEGRVAAPVGRMYLREDGEPGSVLYVKESGGSTTKGWRAM